MTKHRTKIDFLDGRESIIRIGWCSFSRMLRRYGKNAVVTWGMWYTATGEAEPRFHPHV